MRYPRVIYVFTLCAETFPQKSELFEKNFRKETHNFVFVTFFYITPKIKNIPNLKHTDSV